MLQQIIIKRQIAEEDAFLALSHMAEGREDRAPSILLMDRGTLDGKIFLSDEAFAEVLREECLSETILVARYDIVFHLVSTAVDAPEYYS